jgi:hypothetical protein
LRAATVAENNDTRNVVRADAEVGVNAINDPNDDERRPATAAIGASVTDWRA